MEAVGQPRNRMTGRPSIFPVRGGGLWVTPVGQGEEKFITGELHGAAAADFAVTSNGIYLLNAEAAPAPLSCITTSVPLGSLPYTL